MCANETRRLDIYDILMDNDSEYGNILFQQNIKKEEVIIMGDTWRMNVIVGMLLGGVSIFIIYIMLVSRRQEREEKNKDKKGGAQ